MTAALIEIAAAAKHFVARRFPGAGQRAALAVDGVDLRIDRGETLGLVGESGCGKSTLARLVLDLERPTAGTIAFEGRPIATLEGPARAAYRASVQAVFQDPFSSLSPRMRAGSIVAEPLAVQRRVGRSVLAERVTAALAEVGLPADAADRYPHEFSGGQRQRIAIARALIAEPSLVVLDEPISALDVSIRAQVLNLLADLKARRATAYLFIAHDLPAVASLADRIAVMYLGKIVETGPVDAVAERPVHPYTQMLFAAADPERAGAVPPRGEPPSAFAPPPGCRFHPRCPRATSICAAVTPMLRDVDRRQVACHHTGA